MPPTNSTCPFCGIKTIPVTSTYARCSGCDVLISRVPAAMYDETYYYVKFSHTKQSYYRAKLLFHLFRPYLVGQDGVDFGCNDGAFVRVANTEGCAFIGVDINSSALRIAKNVGEGIFLHPDEVTSQFSVVTAFDVIEHFDELEDFFPTVTRYLKPDGHLMITTPNKNSKWHRLFAEGWHGLGIPQYHRYILSRSFLKTTLIQHGYTIETCFTVAPIERYGWKYLLASGYRLERNRFYKLLALPYSALTCLYGKFFLQGEEDTIGIVACKHD